MLKSFPLKRRKIPPFHSSHSPMTRSDFKVGHHYFPKVVWQQRIVCTTGGLTPSEGNVIVRGRPVCDDGWGQNEADVVCRFVFVCYPPACENIFSLLNSFFSSPKDLFIFVAGLLDTAGGVPPQTQDLEMLLEEETLVWTMSNVR